VYTQVWCADRRVGRTDLGIDDPAGAQRDPEIVRIVFMKQRRVVRADANAQNAKSRILEREMMVRLTGCEDSAGNRLRVERSRS
jgi:hypothetical protein